MNMRYYITTNGQIKESASFDESYILVSCGTQFNYSPAKVRKLLKDNTSYAVNLSSGTLSEIFYRGNFFTASSPQIIDRPSEISLKDFLEIIA